MKALWNRLSVGGRLCLAVIAAYFLCAAWGGARSLRARLADETPAYNVVNVSARYQPPSATHWMGTDNLGRYVSARLVQGAWISFQVGVGTSLIVWLCATVASMPGLLFILAISLIAGKGILGILLGIGLTTWVGVCRTIRAEVMKHRDRAYVQAARVLGYSHLRIMFRHILPNVAHLILIQFSIRFPGSVATEVFISFLGIGVQGEPSWGVMIGNARMRLWQGVWWEMTFVTLAIFVLVLVFNHLADELRDILDPALRNERN